MMMEKRTANCPQDKVSVASVEMVKEAVQSLSKGKLNLKGFQTDHLIYAPMICYILLSFLFTSIQSISRWVPTCRVNNCSNSKKCEIQYLSERKL